MTKHTPQQRLGRAAIIRMAGAARIDGQLTLHEGGETHQIGRPGRHAATMTIVRPDAWTRFATRSGCVMSYVDGAWDSPNVVDIFTLAGSGVHSFDKLRRRLRPVRIPWLYLRRGLGNHTREQTRNDIRAHYDLGNDFFELMLDPSMMYSCAIFPHSEATLAQAAMHKLDVVCDKLELEESDHVVEIGSGWGGFAIHAARTRGCRVTTVTISNAQYELARARIREAGLEDRVDVRLEDYRDVRGRYDKLVSIEMIEAVGHRNMGTYFERCSRLLEPDGRMLLQAITIDDRLYDIGKLTKSFIQTEIFPNGCLPSNEVIARNIRRHTDLRAIDHEDLTDHYVCTLQKWRENLDGAVHQLDQAGYDEPFRRRWNLYLSYAEAGFVLRRTAVGQYVFAKPGHSSRTVPRRGYDTRREHSSATG